jgi:hypothetical protein
MDIVTKHDKRRDRAFFTSADKTKLMIYTGGGLTCCSVMRSGCWWHRLQPVPQGRAGNAAWNFANKDEHRG